LPPASPPADTTHLTPPPAAYAPLGRMATADTAGAGARSGGVLGRNAPRHGLLRTGSAPQTPWDPRYAGTSSGAPGLAGDIPFTGGTDKPAAGTDSTRAPGVRPPSPPVAPRDSLLAAPPAAPPDSLRAAPTDSLRNRIDR